MNSGNSFGDRLKSAIKSRKYTQKNLSDLIRIDQDTLTNYIKGKTKPNAEVISRICNALQVSTDWLLTGNDIQRWDVDGPDQMHLTKEEANLLQMYRQLTQKDKTEINILMEVKYSFTREPEER